MRDWLARRSPELVQAERTRRSRKYTIWRAKVVMTLGAECRGCRIKDSRVLQIDHIHGNGTQDRNDRGFSGSGYNYRFFMKVLEDPDFFRKYQVLCANCNWIKKSENNEVSHGCKVRPPRKYFD